MGVLDNHLFSAPFWMVWNPAGHAPTYKHASEASASAEAERLARSNPGQTFVVLQAIEAMRAHDMLRITLTTESQIPF